MKPGYDELPMYLVWHRRFQHDPAHVRLRGQVDAIAADAIRQLGEG